MTRPLATLSSTLSVHFVENGRKSTKFCDKVRKSRILGQVLGWLGSILAKLQVIQALPDHSGQRQGVVRFLQIIGAFFQSEAWADDIQAVAAGVNHLESRFF